MEEENIKIDKKEGEEKTKIESAASADNKEVNDKENASEISESVGKDQDNNSENSEPTEAPKGVHQEGASTSSRPSNEGKANDKPNEVVEDAPPDTSEGKEPVEVKTEPSVIPKSKEGKKEGSWTPMVIVMGISLIIAFSWDKVSFIKNSVHNVLDPSAGWLLEWNLTVGMIIIVLIITLITTLIQKYATDQDALRELKKEQKILQAEMKKYKDHPEKVAELSKRQFQFIPKTMKLTSRGIMFTGVPFILFFRWFTDIFTAMEVATGVPVRFLGFLSWFWFYLIFTMVFSSFLRKWLKVV